MIPSEKDVKRDRAKRTVRDILVGAGIGALFGGLIGFASGRFSRGPNPILKDASKKSDDPVFSQYPKED